MSDWRKRAVKVEPSITSSPPKDEAVKLPSDMYTETSSDVTPSGGGFGVSVKPSWRDRAWSTNPRVVQEQHPDLSTQDRAIVKNFANSPEASVLYLRKNYPNHDIKINGVGQIVMRKQGESDYRVLDPDTGTFSSDFGSDALDLAYDVPAGALESLAATGGALAGAGATATQGGWGGIPAAMIAAGGTGAANEALRQKIGKELGIPQEIDATDVLISGGLSSTAPMLAGAGRSKGLLAGAKDWITKKGLPKAGSMLSGVSEDSLLNYSDDAIRAELKQLERGGVEDFSAQAFDKLKNYVEKRKDDAGDALVQAIDDTGVPVNLSQAKASYENAIRQLEDLPNMTNVEAAKLSKLKADYNKFFGLADNSGPKILGADEVPINASSPLVPDEMSARRAWSLQKDLNQAAKFDTDISPENIFSKGTARDSYFRINDALDQASDGTTSAAKKQYKAAVDFEKEMLPKFEGKTRADSIDKTYKQLSGMGNDSRRMLAERLQKMADDGQLDLTRDAQVLSTFKELGNPKIMPVSSGGTTSTSRTGLAITGGGLVGSQVGGQFGPSDNSYTNRALGGLAGATLATLTASPAAMKAYIRAHRALSRGVQTLTPQVENDLARRAIRSSWMDLIIDDKDTGN